jgi:hypothetical protein
LEKFRLVLYRKCRLFEVIWDIAIAYKHLYTRETTCSIPSLGSIAYLEYDGIRLEPQYMEKPKGIVIKRKDGSRITFPDAIEPTMAMWNEILLSQPDPWRG